MSYIGLAVAAILTQSPSAVPPEQSPADRAVLAAEKAADAAQKAAEAAMRIANAVAPAPAPAPAPTPAAPAAAPAQGWVGNVGAGLSFITGNTQTLTLTGSSAIDRKWEVWALGIRLNGAYGLANPDTNAGATPSTTAFRAAGTVRGDRSFGEGFASIFALAGSEFDHIKNIESRTVGEMGTGLTFFNTKEGDLEKLFLRLDLAIRGGYETRFQYYPVGGPVADAYGIIILAPRAAVTFRWNFSKDVRFTEEIEFVPFLLDPTLGRLLINNNTRLSARLTESLALTTAVLLNFDSMPPKGAGGLTRKPTDVALTVGLEASF